MIKTLTNLLKQDKEKFVVPKGVQDCIPITAIYDDGIFRVGKDKYSKSFKFTDTFNSFGKAVSQLTLFPSNRPLTLDSVKFGFYIYADEG